MKTIENLVFKGGGVLGAAYIGAYQTLQDMRLAGNNDALAPTAPGTGMGGLIYGNVKRVAGTSAGSVFSMMVALGYSAETISGIVAKKDQADFADFCSPDAALHGGFCWGLNLFNWLNDQLKARLTTINANPTFADLHKMVIDPANNGRYKDLHVFAHSVVQSRTIEFSYETTPDVCIAGAVRASGSVPFFYMPWGKVLLTTQTPITKEMIEAAAKPDAASDRYIDGGVAYNYPITTFDGAAANDKTLGFYLQNMSYQSETTPELIVHGIEHWFFTKIFVEKDNTTYKVVSCAVESLFELLNYVKTLTPGTTAAMYPRLAAMTSSATAKTILQKNGELTSDDMPKLTAELTDILKKLGTYKATSGNAAEDIRAIFADIVILLFVIYAVCKGQMPDWLKALITAIKSYLADIFDPIMNFGSILGASINPPANMVFQRDAGRTVFLNCLGYQFADFWIPPCNTQRLIQSGATCTKDYLDLIMYT